MVFEYANSAGPVFTSRGWDNGEPAQHISFDFAVRAEQN